MKKIVLRTKDAYIVDEDNFEQNLDLNTINDTIKQLTDRITILENTINP